MLLVCRDLELRAGVVGVAGEVGVLCCAGVDAALGIARARHFDLVLLDVRAGGNARRAVEAIEDLSGLCHGAAVVMLSRRPSVTEIAEAVALGAYHIIDVQRARWHAELALVLRIAALTRHLRRRPVLSRAVQ